MAGLWRLVCVFVIALFLMPISNTESTFAQNQERCFPETNMCISGRIRTFWEQNDGLRVFGLPIGPQQEEFIEGTRYQVQWFERNRLELHPNTPKPNDVQLGRLGVDRLAQIGKEWQSIPKSSEQQGCRYAAETGHNICGPFLSYWQSHGLEQDGRPGISAGESLALFGLPLGEAQEEQIEGQTFTVQWFERARFELHPEVGPNTILLGRLGSEISTSDAAVKNAIVDRTQDYQGVGYPDQRKIVRDAQGALYIAYRKKYRDADGGEEYRIFVARSTNGGTSWSPVRNNQPIEQVGSYQQRVPAIAIDANNTLHVVWYGSDAQHPNNDDRQIKHASSSDGGVTWTPWKNIAEVPGYNGENEWQEHPMLAVWGTTIAVVWEGIDNESPREPQIKMTRSNDGGQTWSPLQKVAADPREGYSRPTMVATADGSRLYILAYAERGNRRQIVWSTSTDNGATWTPWELVAPDGADQRHVSLTIDDANQLHAVWRQQTGGPQTQVVYASFNGTAWSAPQAIGPSARFQFFPSIAIGRQNVLYVVWTETEDNAKDNPKVGQIMAVSRKQGEEWSQPSKLNADQQSGAYASLPLSAKNSDNVGVVWMDTTDENRRYIRYSTIR